MRKIGISFAFSRSFKGMFRAFLMSLTTLLLFSSLLLVLGSYGLLHFNVMENMAGVIEKGQAVIFLEEDCSNEDTQQIASVLDGHIRTGLIKEYTYVSAMEALRAEIDRFADYPQLYQSFQAGDNPYRASFVMTAVNEESFEAMLTAMNQLTITRINDEGDAIAYDPIASVISHQKTFDRAESVLATIRNGCMIFALFLLLVCLFVLINTIRLSIFSQQKELSVMRFLGATHGFMVAPFVWQGVLLGAFSAGVAFFTQWAIYQTIYEYLTKQYAMIALLPFAELWYYLLAAFLFVGLFVGLLGGLLATSRYLRDKD